MELIFITNEPHKAAVAQEAGVDRIMVDLEIKGKIARQGRLDTLISHHSIEDVFSLRSVLNRTKLMVRVNPMDSDTTLEIDQAIRYGADIIMLPMFTTVSEVEIFIKSISKRARTSLLLETGPALARIDHILDISGIDEIFIGLNDLHLSLKLDFMFELLSGGVVEFVADRVRKKGIKFGLGGIARLNRGRLSSNLILSEHVRLGSSITILSRDFANIFTDLWEDDLGSFVKEVSLIRSYVSDLQHLTQPELFANSIKVKEAVLDICRGLIECPVTKE